MDVERVLALPIRMFWCLSRHIDRIRAEQELRLLDLHLVASSVAAGAGKDHVDQYRAVLMEQRGTVVKEQEKVSSKNDILALMKM